MGVLEYWARNTSLHYSITPVLHVSMSLLEQPASFLLRPSAIDRHVNPMSVGVLYSMVRIFIGF